MAPSRCDAWTRRRFGAATIGLTAGWLGLAERDGARARNTNTNKNKKKKKGKKTRKRQCEPLGTRCNPKNRKRVCCGTLFCQVVPELGGNHCCQTRFAPCSRDADCCANLTCVGEGNRFCDS